MSKSKRRRASSSDEDEGLSDGYPEIDESILDVSCNQVRLSPPSVIGTPQTSPLHNQSYNDGESNPPCVDVGEFSVHLSEGTLTDCGEVLNDTVPLADSDDDCSYQEYSHNMAEIFNITCCGASQDTNYPPDYSSTIPLVADADSRCFEDGLETGTNRLSEESNVQGQSHIYVSESDSDTEDSLSVGISDLSGDGYGLDGLCSDTSDSNDSDQSLIDEDIDSNHMEPLIYNGADITVHDSMTALLAYIVRHEISGKEIVDLLNLVNLHCRKEGNRMHTSLYFFKKYFSLLDAPVIYHYYCGICCSKLSDKKAICPNIVSHPHSSEVNVFVELPLIPQFQALFSKEEFFTNFNHSKNRTKFNLSNIEDIYDGKLYQEFIDNDFFSEHHPLNFSTIWNTDGVPVFHSNNKSLWPIFLNVLELPPHLRFKQENTIIAGLWFGRKPHVNLMLSPLLPSFQAIFKGFSVKPFRSDKVVTVQGVVLAATCDLPAKIMMLGMASFSGHFGCQICKIKGESVKIVKKSKKKKNEDKQKEEITSAVWVYKYSNDLELRNHNETVELSREAQSLMEKTGNPKVNVFGVKFPSATFKIMYDAIRGFSIDDLHTIYIGVSKTLMSLWFEGKHSSQPFSIRKHLVTVDKRLKAIKLPNFLERGVVGIEYDISNWKGKDYLTWLHYLSVPVLDGILPDRYLEHYVNLVLCVQLLQSDSIARDDLIACEKTLNMYVKNFEILYGSRHMTMVFHSLLHLVYVVTNLGPLKYLSCFPYEGLNGAMLKMIHGTRYIETQLASSTYLVQKLPDRLRSLKPDSDVKNYCERVLQPSKKLKVLDQITDDTFSVGTYKTISCASSNYVIVSLKTTVDIGECSECKLFLRLKKGKHLFLSRRYERATKNCAYTCSFNFNGALKYGSIDVFVRFCPDVNFSNFLYFAIIEIAQMNPYFVGTRQVSHIMKYSLTGEFVAVPVGNLKDMMVYIAVDNNTYVAEPLDHSLKS